MKYEQPGTDDRRIWDLLLTQTYQAAVVAADEAGVFAALGEKPATIAELAARLDFDGRATGILLRLLGALGLLTQRLGRFQLTDEARHYLVKSGPFYWGAMLSVGINDGHRTRLLAKLRTKGSDRVTGPEGTPQVSGEGRVADNWAAGTISLEQARGVAERMHAHSLLAAIGAARNYDFTGIRRVLDVGGGSGCFMIAMAQKHPHLRCTIMELSAMCEVARDYIKEGEVSDRVDTVAVDMFRQPWPKGYDALFFSNIWHDWNFQTCRWLAARAFEALPAGGRIMLHEMLLDDDGAGPVTAASFSMLMLLGTQGQQFTFGELKGILEGAGFTGVETMQTSVYYSITTGYKR
ncbi:MAG TPA: methyltransferase [Terriglobia bacterium]|jgi:acetylserotonin N-methyltransferase